MVRVTTAASHAARGIRTISRTKVTLPKERSTASRKSSPIPTQVMTSDKLAMLDNSDDVGSMAYRRVDPVSVGESCSTPGSQPDVDP
eukprot:12999396-Heterocapsa_arctica.AAC.1